MFRNPFHLLGTLTFIAMMLVIDCNNFFLKYLLFIPANHDVLIYRVALWGFCAIATSKEWYEYVVNPNIHRIGPFSWLSFYTALIELMAVIKFSKGMFTEPFPLHVKVIWTAIFILLSMAFYTAVQNGVNNKEHLDKLEYNLYNPPVEVT